MRANQNRRSNRRCAGRSEEHTSELQSQSNLVCRLLLEKKKKPVRAHGSCPGGRRRGDCVRGTLRGRRCGPYTDVTPATSSARLRLGRDPHLAVKSSWPV